MRDKSIRRFMRQALRLAARGRYRTSPNPMVGAVVVTPDGRVVGTGFHGAYGRDHAEVEALREAGDAARGATMVVTLEPCNHQGNTPPCTEALIEGGIRKVVVCHADPNPRVRGVGFARLQANDIEVEAGVLCRQAIELNLPFLVSAIAQRPSVTLKWAASLDGKIATRTGESQWISSPESRRWALMLREEHDAILVGSGTVLADDPRLTRRMGRAKGPITRVILDRRLRTPPGARIFAEPGPVLIYTRAPAKRHRDLLAAGADVVVPQGEWLSGTLNDLHQRRRVNSLLVEGGGQIHAAFLAAGLFERLEVTCAPMVIGGEHAPGAVRGLGVATLDEAARLDRLRVRKRGCDVVLWGLREGLVEEVERYLREIWPPGVSDSHAAGEA